MKDIIDKITKNNNVVKFVSSSSFNDKILNNLLEITYDCKDSETSAVFINGCTLAVPKKNLITGKKNETIS